MTALRLNRSCSPWRFQAGKVLYKKNSFVSTAQTVIAIAVRAYRSQPAAVLGVPVDCRFLIGAWQAKAL